MFLAMRARLYPESWRNLISVGRSSKQAAQRWPPHRRHALRASCFIVPEARTLDDAEARVDRERVDARS
jgi:hypothetical protein